MAEQVKNQDSIEKDESTSVLRLTGSLGMGLPEGQFRVFLPKGSRLPCEASARFLTRLKEYNKAKIRVFMGDSEYVEDNVFLGEIQLDNIRLNKDGQALIDIIFQADINYMLLVQVKDEPGKKSSTVTLPLPYGDDLQSKGTPPDLKKAKSRREKAPDTDYLVEKIALLEEKLGDMEKELMSRYKSDISGKQVKKEEGEPTK